MRWDRYDIATLLAYRSQNLTMNQIAMRMGCSYHAINSKLLRLNRKKVEVRKSIDRPKHYMEMMAVEKSLVPGLYEKGWRFEQFTAEGLCVMKKERAL